MRQQVQEILKDKSLLLTQAFFIISMASGIVLVFAYHPFDAYNSIQKINYIIPFGTFFRQLHYFGSELFLITLFIHIASELVKKEIRIPLFSWNYAIMGTAVIFILMFSGFVLKADQEANLASLVAFSLLKDTPILNNLLPLFQDTTSFYWKFFIWHIVFLPLLLTFGIYKHTKKISVKVQYFIFALAIVMLVLTTISMPNDIPLDIVVNYAQSPWFFLGAENLLGLGVSPVVVNLILALPFVFLVLIYFVKYKNIFKILLLIWVVTYVCFSI